MSRSVLRSAFGLLLLLAMAAMGQAANPSLRCRVCEDVAQTWHDSYRCAGESLELWSGSPDAPAQACDQPRFSCEQLAGDLAYSCRQMESEFIDDDAAARILWKSQMEFGQSYQTCVKLGRCEADPAPEEGAMHPCHEAFSSEEGKNNILFPGFTQSCTEECYLCGWLVREWPLFQEICTPDGTGMVNAVDPDRQVTKEFQLAKLAIFHDYLNPTPPTPPAEQNETGNNKAMTNDPSLAPQTDPQQMNDEQMQMQMQGDIPPGPQEGPESANGQQGMDPMMGADMQGDLGGEPGMDSAFVEESMRQRRRAWERQYQYDYAYDEPHAQMEQGMDAAVFLESSTQLGSHSRSASNLRGMARSWSRATHRAVQQVLQAQAEPMHDPMAAPMNDPMGAPMDAPMQDPMQDPMGDPMAGLQGEPMLDAPVVPEVLMEPPSAAATLRGGLNLHEPTDGPLVDRGPEYTGSNLKLDCFSMWRYFARSRKAKFFASWKRNLGIAITPADVERSNNWDANIACKCLGQCELDPFEQLGLIRQCRYDERDRTLMEFAFPNPN